ncbi:MAG: ABC transporter substrate-binding protein [Corticimicrobacter sp.]|uniref:ABC transporter substrate-binding protein n=1 Tax=Corticimicrobacter sp. TaxID=2678536 RepID=UPI0032D9C950
MIRSNAGALHAILHRLFSICLLIGALLPALATAQSDAADTHLITDMAGRQTVVPHAIHSVATVGSVPVLNSLLFALDSGDLLVNGLPDFARTPRWAFQYLFAPGIRTLASFQNPDRSVRMEMLHAHQPDLVLTMDRQTADRLQQAGLATLHLSWRHPQDVRKAVDLLGEILGRQEQAARFRQHFDQTLARVQSTLEHARPVAPRVLYFNPRTLTQPHLVAEWWITAAGGHSVSQDDRQTESRTFTLEQLLAWDPEILIVGTRQEAEMIQADPRLANIAAVRTHRILVTPAGAHPWGNRTAEQALTVLWAATRFHPGLFSQETLHADVQAFYRDIFGITLTPQQITTILSGGPSDYFPAPARSSR